MIESTHQLRSVHLGNTRSIWVRAPDDLQRVDTLLVFLDGELYRERVGALATLDALEARSDLDATLAVFVSVASPEARWIECPCHPPFARFIADEFLPWLARAYPASVTMTNRVLIGLSYTGLAAAYVALQAPGCFNRVIAQSGSFWSNDCWLIEQYRNSPPAPQIEFHLSVGTRETQVNVQHKEDLLQVVSQIDAVRAFHEVLVRKGHRAAYVEFDGAHEFTAWERTLPDVLRWAVPGPKPGLGRP